MDIVEKSSREGDISVSLYRVAWPWYPRVHLPCSGIREEVLRGKPR